MNNDIILPNGEEITKEEIARLIYILFPNYSEVKERIDVYIDKTNNSYYAPQGVFERFSIDKGEQSSKGFGYKIKEKDLKGLIDQYNNADSPYIFRVFFTNNKGYPAGSVKEESQIEENVSKVAMASAVTGGGAIREFPSRIKREAREQEREANAEPFATMDNGVVPSNPSISTEKEDKDGLGIEVGKIVPPIPSFEMDRDNGRGTEPLQRPTRDNRDSRDSWNTEDDRIRVEPIIVPERNIPKEEKELKKENEIIETLEEIHEKEPVVKQKVVRINKRHLGSKILLASFLLFGFKACANEKTEEINTNLDYEVEEVQETNEPIENVLEREAERIAIGDDVLAENGDVFNTNSLMRGTSKDIGGRFDAENKFEGDYRVTGFSIVKDGKIIDYIEDFNGEQEGPNLGDYVTKVCEDNNISKDDVSIRIHLGNQKDITRLGWIDITDLLTVDDIDESYIQKVVTTIDHTGTVENFTGTTITLDNGAQIPVKDGNDAYYKKGDKVIGSDGNTYTILALNEEQETVEGKEGSLDYDVSSNIALGLGTSMLILGLIDQLRTAKKNQENNEHPEYYSFDTDEELDDFMDEFEKNKEEYENNSSFGKAIRWLAGKDIEEARFLSEDQADELVQTVSDAYLLSNGDKVGLDKGQVYFTRDSIEEPEPQYISDDLLGKISNIGKDNEVQRTGIVTDELRGVNNLKELYQVGDMEDSNGFSRR